MTDQQIKQLVAKGERTIWLRSWAAPVGFWGMAVGASLALIYAGVSIMALLVGSLLVIPALIISRGAATTRHLFRRAPTRSL